MIATVIYIFSFQNALLLNQATGHHHGTGQGAQGTQMWATDAQAYHMTQGKWTWPTTRQAVKQLVDLSVQQTNLEEHICMHTTGKTVR